MPVDAAHHPRWCILCIGTNPTTAIHPIKLRSDELIRHGIRAGQHGLPRWLGRDGGTKGTQWQREGAIPYTTTITALRLSVLGKAQYVGTARWGMPLLAAV